MRTHPCEPRHAGACALVLVLMLALSPVAVAAAPAASAVAAPVATFVVGGWFDSFTAFLEGQLSDRTRMIQFAMGAMILGLFVIWWRK